MEKKFNMVFIIPPLLGMRNDPFGNIPSPSIGVPYIASYLQSRGISVNIIDGYGINPFKQYLYKNKYFVQGLSLSEIVEHIPKNADLIGISTHSGAVYSMTKTLISLIKVQRPNIPIVIGGSFASIVYSDFIEAGADYIVLGEGEQTTHELIKHIQGLTKIENVDGIVYKGGINPKTKFIKNLDELPFPAIDLLPLKNYWKVGYTHGPYQEPYAVIITSRGCPLNCNFCTTAKIWQRKWRGRSAKNVVDELEYYIKKFNIHDFHCEDDNLTVNKERAKDICREIIARELPLTWQILATKVEQMDEELMLLLKQSRCRYLSISPETGSPRILKKMNKSFDHSHGLKIVALANKYKIKTQCCFVIGYPGETAKDRKMTLNYIKKLVKVGVDEIGMYIMTPLPGAKVYEEYKDILINLEYEEQSCFSPLWRPDFVELARFRKKAYILFLLYKLIYHPEKMIEHAFNLIRKRYETKIESGLHRTIKMLLTRKKKMNTL